MTIREKHLGSEGEQPRVGNKVKEDLHVTWHKVRLSYTNINTNTEVSIVKPLTVAYVSLHTVIPHWPAVNFML